MLKGLRKQKPYDHKPRTDIDTHVGDVEYGKIYDFKIDHIYHMPQEKACQ